SPRLSVVLIRRRGFRCQGDGPIGGVETGETALPLVLASRMGLALPLKVSYVLEATPHSSEMTETKRAQPKPRMIQQRKGKAHPHNGRQSRFASSDMPD
ncbi:MAG TPA: hypothetical protein VFP47_12880, partial [Pyrinomonadaceae bacterium]|nr:hypothetical protein [Pyrinomonadaceae bacterium]